MPTTDELDVRLTAAEAAIAALETALATAQGDITTIDGALADYTLLTELAAELEDYSAELKEEARRAVPRTTGESNTK